MKNKDIKKEKGILNRASDSLEKTEEPSKIGLVVLLFIYLATSFFVTQVSKAQGAINLFDIRVPYSVFTGVLAPLSNISIILMVVFYKKIGIILAILLLAIQFPVLLLNFFLSHNPSSLPGVCNNLLTIIAIIIIYQRNKKIEEYQKTEVDYFINRQKFSQRLFEETATALVNAIDAKDTYSHGHSIRVAEYSEKIARALGKNDEECYRIYYAALLHDVGKIGIPDNIINKSGKLTQEEYGVIKEHPVMGNQILKSISEYPYLSIGAHFHHERFDGCGYPAKLKGEDIPEIARIISVADAYDAMSSNRSYRDAIPQQLVREEIVKGAGTQFDPEYACIMQKLIDLDIDYKMKERKKNRGVAERKEIICEEYRSEVSNGILLVPFRTVIHMTVTPEGKSFKDGAGAAIILFDSLDERYHKDEKSIRDMYYFEYCEIGMDGHITDDGVRKIKTSVSESKNKNIKNPDGSIVYEIEAVKRKDHAMLRIDDGNKLTEVIIALPDSSRYVYFGATGQYCRISDINYSRTERISDDYIPRIAEKISFIDVPQGDIPNIQIDGSRTDVTAGILLEDKLELCFHTLSLPTARLIWHCPFVVIFSSKEGRVNGEEYREYATLRMDGELLDDGNGEADNKLSVKKTEEFDTWDLWKEKNKKGYDCTVYFERSGNTVTTITENLGISVRNITTILDGKDDIYISLTGDQCALTNIRIRK